MNRLAVASAILKASDIKQYFYCPRIVYFTYCQPVRRKVTYKMEAGQSAHERTEDLEERRKLRSYGLTEGERRFHVFIESESLGLAGTLDMVILTRRECFPVEFKDSLASRYGLNHKYQLTAYGLLAEAKFGRPVRAGFVNFIPEKRVARIDFTDGMRMMVRRAARTIHRIIETETIPPPTRRTGRCADCEYLNFCGGG